MSSTLLLVEDDATLRMLIADALSMIPVKVVECDCADDALIVLEGTSLINLVLTDIRMPGHLDGLELANLIWARWPDLPVILTSGHCVLKSEQLPSCSTFIAKPWSLDILFETVTKRLP
ncbi:response regulator (plasmid) [Pseudomonas sp. HR96]|uniref:response regulator n=1 Tax=Pseudomonas sp. HR96 TaxID=1027966 RepID=UPI002A75A5B8|nr:response regulator [Pseudomonas sp. HR96]WPP02399.1 response regulator [Pseudomonas sp. HR96]